MHRSRLAGFIIDCNVEDLDEAAEFWGRALGFAVGKNTDPDDEDYVPLDSGSDGLHVEVQRVSHSSRVHLDIETDDIEAEVHRLERLGAQRIAKVRNWWVMEAPTGQRFCVVRPQGADFAARANEWP